jgi:hypothetical protein
MSLCASMRLCESVICHMNSSSVHPVGAWLHNKITLVNMTMMFFKTLVHVALCLLCGLCGLYLLCNRTKPWRLSSRMKSWCIMQDSTLTYSLITCSQRLIFPPLSIIAVFAFYAVYAGAGLCCVLFHGSSQTRLA